ncbi:AAA family ATPase [Nitrosomonas halophila]|uniref:ORC1/DEAH AAA+ ATPase domain-containing protein n=1 Tax=Nitrosomonas halophila TaxID=44576 RepID=A0A1H3FEN5_9PROT|nr:AAA family ATPase [Nitrosomonas halophila]SDX89482.1 hypothetical protein SAMN05421881_101173 [Nitrosomonas halophila]
MKNVFVKTSNYERFKEGLAAVEGRGAQESSLLLITGEAGYGKSETVDQWAVQVGAAYLRAKTDWTPRYFLTELAENLKVDPSGRSKEVFGRVSGYLGRNQTPIVIDEVDHCMRNNAQVLEAIRDLSDLTEVTVVLVGMEKVQTKISKHLQISSRIAHVVTFGPATLEDVMATCQQKCEVVVEPELAREIHRQSKGRMREVMNAIALVEREGKRNGLASVGLEAMAGRALTLDWQASRPRLIKGGR